MSDLAILGGEPVRTKPFIWHAILGDAEKTRVNEVLDSGMLSGFIANASDAFYGGKQVLELESLIKDYFDVPHAVTVNSATAGLHAGLAACGIGPGDEVIVTPYSMAASATAILMNQGIPVFADIETETYGLDPEDVERKITPQTKAIVVVHLFGHAAKIKEIMAIAKKHNLKVIEDCAQSPACKSGDQYVGTFGDVGIFSLNQHKTITSGEGGFCITKDEDLALRMQLVRNHGEVIAEAKGVEDVSNMIGYNYRMTELEAAVAVEQFKKLDELNDYRIDLAHYLTQELSDIPGLGFPKIEQKSDHVYFVLPVQFDAEAFGLSRETLVKALGKEGIPSGPGYVRPIYYEAAYQQKIAYGKEGWPFTAAKNPLSYEKGICPNCEKMHHENLIVLGICKFPHTCEDMDDVIKAFRKVYENREALSEANVS